MNITPVRIYINGNGSISFYGPNNTLITNLQNLNGAKQANGQIIFEGDDKTLSFYVYQLTSIESATFTLPYTALDSRFFNPSTYASKLNSVYQDVAEYVLVNKNGGASFVGGVVAVYPNYASFPATGQEAVIYIDEGTKQAYFWDGAAYQLLVSTGVEQYANFASFPVTGSANVIYIDMSVPEPYVWGGAAYQSLGGGSVAVAWGDITGTLSDQTDLQAALNAKFNNPTGTSSEYLNGAGTPTTFPSIPAQYNPSSGTGISITGSYPNQTISNTLPDQTVSLTPGTNIGISGTYPNFTINNTQSLSGYVPTTRTLTINGTAQDLSADRTWSVGDMLTSVYDTDVDGVVDSAERIQIVVRNSTGSTLTKGQIVYLNGATGNRPNAVLAQANAEATSSKTIGMVIADIPNNTDGQIAVNGTLHDLNTLAFTAGDTLWLSATTPGGMVANTPPSEPNHTVFIGYVARSSPTQGRIVLAIQNGYELDELHGVQITTPTTWQVLRYDSTSGLWINSSLSASILPGGIDAAKIGAGTVDNTEFGYLDGVTSSIQTQLGSKTPTTRSISTTAPLSGGGDLSADRTLSISQATTSTDGYLSSTDWNTFSGKQSALGYTAENTANKQNSLAADGTGVKFPTVDAVNNLSMIDRGKRMFSYFFDFIGPFATFDGLQSSVTGGTISQLGGTNIPNRTNQQGVITFSTTTANSNFAFIGSNSLIQLWFGGGVWNFETAININNLSTSIERYRWISGFGSNITTGTETDGVFFTYDEGGTLNGTAASPNWQCVTVANSVRTLTTTSTAVAAGAWTKLRIEINAAGTSVAFYVNGTLVATHTTNIPVPNRYVTVKQGIAKTIGTTARLVHCDYIGYENILTTAR